MRIGSKESCFCTVEMWGCSLVPKRERCKLWEQGVIRAALRSFDTSHILSIEIPQLIPPLPKIYPSKCLRSSAPCQTQQGSVVWDSPRVMSVCFCLPSCGQTCSPRMTRASSEQVQTIFFFLSSFVSFFLPPIVKIRFSFGEYWSKAGCSKSLFNQISLVQQLTEKDLL